VVELLGLLGLLGTFDGEVLRGIGDRVKHQSAPIAVKREIRRARLNASPIAAMLIDGGSTLLQLVDNPSSAEHSATRQTRSRLC